jgi:hypothetical protein
MRDDLKLPELFCGNAFYRSVSISMKISHRLWVEPKVALPYFIEQKSGKIINISSMNGGAYFQ